MMNFGKMSESEFHFCPVQQNKSNRIKQYLPELFIKKL
jgi:hypothetical protein